MSGKALSACIFLLLLASNYGYAQIAIGAGFECGTAVFINKGVFAGRPSVGLAGILSYAPRESKLFPSVTYLIKNIVVPIDNDHYPGLNGLATSQNFALNLNYGTRCESTYNQLFIGIGIAKIRPQTDLSDKMGNAVTLIDTANFNLYPMIQIGGKYMRRILNNASFYVGIEAHLRYIRMHSENVYYLQQDLSSVKATIAGEIISPGLQVHLDYFFGRDGD
jgi:hypothetical protein